MALGSPTHAHPRPLRKGAMTLTHEPTGHVRAVIDTGDGVLVAWCASEQEAREMARAVEQERGRDGAGDWVTGG